MTNKELIQKLSTLDPEAIIMVCGAQGCNDWYEELDIDCINESSEEEGIHYINSEPVVINGSFIRIG